MQIRAWLRRTLAVITLLGLSGTGHAASVDDLVRAYPEALSGFDGVNLIWRDGTRMPVGVAQPPQTAKEGQEHGSIADQLAVTYPAGGPLAAPTDDPGRTRNQAFFDKMYGDCKAGQVAPNLVRIAWLPKSGAHNVMMTRVNGLDRRLEAVSRELDELPPEDRKFLYPIGGTYNCRSIAGADRTSMHSWGAAIDLNTKFSDYWRWSRSARGETVYRNRIPPEIVAIFERHGFIWGGRWSHFDTMHFEYRPELLHYRPDTEE
ncbi:M15 family metallopeptidase [Acidisphaera sp. L21]|uniref:M15 family metallopeptidase n=1 Tax=Acidisphaera sp. L21 TaxID=1641851 RepID=UPI00131A8A6C|nr:M15 family metallopeptidase [Acidisphaera sp. L21]